MKPAFLLILISCLFKVGNAQKIDSIFFNLYTDSLKKGTYNYINVDGKFSDGSYRPLTDKILKFTASSGQFSGNSLFIDSSFMGDKIVVKVSLISNPAVTKETTIYIKKYTAVEKLKTLDEILQNPKSSKKKKN